MTRLRIAGLLAAGLLVSSCGGSGDAEDATSSRYTERYGAALGRLGFRITRAGVTEAMGTEEYVKDGTHLAIYVVPSKRLTPEAYLSSLADVADVFLPDVFDDDNRIASFDVCQEPHPDGTSQPAEGEPPPVTQVLVTRDQAALVDWEAADAQELVASAEARPNRLGLYVNDEVKASELWRALH